MKKLPDSLRQAVEFFRNRVENNVKYIRVNTKNPKKENFISKDPDSAFQKNKRMIEENKDLLDIQKQIINYAHKYQIYVNKDTTKEITSPKQPEYIPSIQEEVSNIQNDVKEIHKNVSHIIEMTREEAFEKTIIGELAFDKFHPLFKDEKFFNKLLNTFTEKEEYEKCSELMNIKKSCCPQRGELIS